MATTTLGGTPTVTSSTSTATCVTATPGQYGRVPPDSCNSYYEYDPSFGGNLAFAALFGLSTVCHLVQAVLFKKRYCWVLLMGGLWETAAFVIKTLGSRNQQEMQYAIWGQLLFLLAPLWINAFAYMTVARMVYFGLPQKKIWGIKATRLTLIFVWLDIICFLVQGGGGSLLSGDSSANLKSIGMKIYTAGIGLQLGFVVIFIGMTLWFYRSMHQVTGGRVAKMRFLIWTMLLVLIMIVVRIIFRLVEFGPGINHYNPMLSNELYPFMLDAFPMLLAFVALNVMHPGLILKGPDGDFPRLSRAEKKAIKQQKKDDKKFKKEEKRRRKAAKKGNKLDAYVLTEVVRTSSSPNEQTGGDNEWPLHSQDRGNWSRLSSV